MSKRETKNKKFIVGTMPLVVGTLPIKTSDLLEAMRNYAEATNSELILYDKAGQRIKIPDRELK